MVCPEICCADYSVFTSQGGAEERRCLMERLREKAFVLFVDGSLDMMFAFIYVI